MAQENNQDINYDGELTLEALSVLDIYTKNLCNASATSRKLKKNYQRIVKYLKQPYVREIFKLKLLEKGITPDKIADVVNRGLDAIDKDNKPDYLAQYKFSQLACEIFEVLKYQAKADININNNVVVNNIKTILEDAYRHTNRLPVDAEGTE